MESVQTSEEKNLFQKIKRCPMCGGYSVLERKSKTVIKGEPRYVTYVRCTQCDARGPRILLDDANGVSSVTEARQIAIKYWNRRVGKDAN